MNIVRVRWQDAMGEPGRLSLEEASELAPVELRTVGYLIHRDRGKLVLATDLGDDRFCRGITVIPAACVKDVQRLSCSEAPKPADLPETAQ